MPRIIYFLLIIRSSQCVLCLCYEDQQHWHLAGNKRVNFCHNLLYDNHTVSYVIVLHYLMYCIFFKFSWKWLRQDIFVCLHLQQIQFRFTLYLLLFLECRGHASTPWWSHQTHTSKTMDLYNVKIKGCKNTYMYVSFHILKTLIDSPDTKACYNHRDYKYTSCRSSSASSKCDECRWRADRHKLTWMPFWEVTTSRSREGREQKAACYKEKHRIHLTITMQRNADRTKQKTNTTQCWNY